MCLLETGVVTHQFKTFIKDWLDSHGEFVQSAPYQRPEGPM